LDISSGSALKAVHMFKDEGLLNCTIVGQAHLYWLNNDEPVVKALKRMNILIRLREADLVERFTDADGAIISIIMYGSCSSGDYDEKSDLDILVISSSGQSRLARPVRELEDRLGMQVNVEIFNLASWNKLKRKNDVFVSEVRRNHIIIYGSDLI
jgi:hypothetical protein